MLLKDYILPQILSNVNKELINLHFHRECFNYLIESNPKLTLREYVFKLEKVVMEINKLIFLEKKNFLDFFDIDIESFKRLYDKTNKKAIVDTSYLSIYL